MSSNLRSISFRDMPRIAPSRSATQTLTVIVRGIALGELTWGNSRKALFKEAIVGIGNGVVLHPGALQKEIAELEATGASYEAPALRMRADDHGHAQFFAAFGFLSTNAARKAKAFSGCLNQISLVVQAVKPMP